MRYLIRLLAVLAAATICLSPIALATAAHADGPNPEFQYLKQDHLAQLDDSEGYARNGGVVVSESDGGYARNGGVVVPETDPGYARNGGVVMAQQIMPTTPADTGVDAATVALLALLGAGLVVVGAGSAVVVRRQHHHLAHPA